jgi:hypothetical protein
MTTRTRSFLARLLGFSAVGLAVVLVTAGGGFAARPLAHAAGSCPPPKYPGSGYFTSLSVKNTSCSTGSRVAVAYYRCRLRHGKAGRCSGGVLGFSCSERRVSISTEIDARVTCRHSKEEVVHTYQQNLH